MNDITTKDFKSNYSYQELLKVWDEFANVPINFQDEIEEHFYCWQKGTYRFDIWHWFDEKLPNGIYEWALA